MDADYCEKCTCERCVKYFEELDAIEYHNLMNATKDIGWFSQTEYVRSAWRLFARRLRARGVRPRM